MLAPGFCRAKILSSPLPLGNPNLEWYPLIDPGFEGHYVGTILTSSSPIDLPNGESSELSLGKQVRQ